MFLRLLFTPALRCPCFVNSVLTRIAPAGCGCCLAGCFAIGILPGLRCNRAAAAQVAMRSHSYGMRLRCGLASQCPGLRHTCLPSLYMHDCRMWYARFVLVAPLVRRLRIDRLYTFVGMKSGMGYGMGCGI